MSKLFEIESVYSICHINRINKIIWRRIHPNNWWTVVYGIGRWVLHYRGCWNSYGSGWCRERMSLNPKHSRYLKQVTKLLNAIYSSKLSSTVCLFYSAIWEGFGWLIWERSKGLVWRNLHQTDFQKTPFPNRKKRSVIAVFKATNIFMLSPHHILNLCYVLLYLIASQMFNFPHHLLIRLLRKQ